MNRKPILLVVGGSYGSEAKGTVVGHLVKERNVEYAVRTGAVNAGHSVPYKGKTYKNQLIPVAWVNPNTKLVIGAGAYVHPEILAKEVMMINDATGEDVKKRLYIDERAGIHLDIHHDAEREDKLHEKMGSTGEGCMEAAIDKMRRDSSYELFSQSKSADGYQIVDTVKMLNHAYDDGKQILIEGTQGTMLDFHLGHYPFVTSRQTFASNWITEAGLSPILQYEIIMVVRTFPIRVAGNSGPLPMEISWVKLANEINAKLRAKGKKEIVSDIAIREFKKAELRAMEELNLPNKPTEHWSPKMRHDNAEALSKLHQKALSLLSQATLDELKNLFELTTVTKKLRRIARLDLGELKYATMLNRPTSIALTFLNYVFPELQDAESWDEIKRRPNADAYAQYLREIELAAGVPIKYVNVSPLGIIKVR